MTTTASSDRLSSANVSPISRNACALSALTGGRSKVTVATPLSMTVRMYSMVQLSRDVGLFAKKDNLTISSKTGGRQYGADVVSNAGAVARRPRSCHRDGPRKMVGP